MLGMGVTEVADSIGRNDLRLSGAAVITEELSIGPAAIDDVGIGRIGRDVSAFAGACGVPVAEGDGAVIAAAENVDAAAILLRAVNVVRKIIVNRHVIELCGRLIEPTAPGAAAIHAYAHALIAAKNHALRIAWIDPQGMVVIATGGAFYGPASFFCIGCARDKKVWSGVCV